MDNAIFNISDLDKLEISVEASDFGKCVDVSAKGIMTIPVLKESREVRFHVARIPIANLTDFIKELEKFEP